MDKPQPHSVLDRLATTIQGAKLGKHCMKIFDQCLKNTLLRRYSEKKGHHRAGFEPTNS